MSRRQRLRSLSDSALTDEIGAALVEALMGDWEATERACLRIERAHRELAKRHRAGPTDGCTCRVCFETWPQPLEA